MTPLHSLGDVPTPVLVSWSSGKDSTLALESLLADPIPVRLGEQVLREGRFEYRNLVPIAPGEGGGTAWADGTLSNPSSRSGASP